MTTYIHPTAVVCPNVTLGDGVYIGPHCIIGASPEYPGRHPLTPHGNVVIGDGTILHGLVTVDAATEEGGTTIIGPGCTLMKHSHVGHDANLHQKVTLSCGAKIGGYAVVCDHSTVGLNASVHQKSFVPKGTMIGANAFYKGAYWLEFLIFAGVPAKVIGQNWRLTEKLSTENK